MVGTLLNVGTVIAGTLLGRAVGSRFTPRIRESVMHGIGLMTIVIGITQVLKGENPLIVLGAMVLGAITGELLHLEAGIDRLGAFAERKLTRGEVETGGGDFARGFVVTSILFCVGPMTLLGCLDDGLRGDYQVLALKATLDGISALAFASALGWGVMLSALTVLVVQGALTLGAGILAPYMQDQALVAHLTAAGGVMMIGLGIRILEIRPIRVANFLPALLYAPLLVLLERLLRGG